MKQTKNINPFDLYYNSNYTATPTADQLCLLGANLSDVNYEIVSNFCCSATYRSHCIFSLTSYCLSYSFCIPLFYFVMFLVVPQEILFLFLFVISQSCRVTRCGNMYYCLKKIYEMGRKKRFYAEFEEKMRQRFS